MSNLMELEEATNKNTAIAQGIELMRLAAMANEEVELSEFTDFIHYLAMIATKNADNVAIDTFLFIPCDSFLLVL